MYSVTKIQTFNDCKNRYKLSYIDKVEQSVNEAFIKGRKIHKSLETLDESDDFVKYFFNTNLGSKYKDVIINAQKEVRIGLDFKNGKIIPCVYSKECLFGGVIDVLYNNIILDYKTGRYKEKQDYIQLMYYAVWLFLNSDYDSVTVSYLYVEHDKENTTTLYRKDLNALLKHLVSNIINIRKYEENPVEVYNPSWKCEWCSVRKHCKMNLDNLEKLVNDTRI